MDCRRDNRVGRARAGVQHKPLVGQSGSDVQGVNDEVAERPH
jgi:hypothetical protein